MSRSSHCLRCCLFVASVWCVGTCFSVGLINLVVVLRNMYEQSVYLAFFGKILFHCFFFFFSLALRGDRSLLQSIVIMNNKWCMKVHSNMTEPLLVMFVAVFVISNHIFRFVSSGEMRASRQPKIGCRNVWAAVLLSLQNKYISCFILFYSDTFRVLPLLATQLPRIWL